MAIFKYLPGVEVTVNVDGRALEEYVDPDAEEEDFTVTRYIESTTGVFFKFGYLVKTAATRGAGLGFKFYVDGENSESFVITAEDARESDILESSPGFDLGCDALGIWKTRPYKFAELQKGNIMNGIAILEPQLT